MRPGRLFWKLFLAFALLVGGVLGVCAAVVLDRFETVHREQVEWMLRTKADALATAVTDRFDARHGDELQTIARQVASTEALPFRVTFVLADGTVLGDTLTEAARMESLADRPEIRQALAEGTGRSLRWSHAAARHMLYVARRVGPEDRPLGVVRVAVPAEQLRGLTDAERKALTTPFFVVFAVGMIVSWALAVYGSERVERLVEPARSLARGNLSGPIPARGSDELARLARSLERIRRRWRRQVRRLERERRTLAALLEQLREGVVAADADGHLVLVNPAACRLLDLSPSRSPRDLEGRLVEEYIPHRAVQDLLRPHEPSDDFPTEEGTPEDRQRETASRHPAECQVRIGERTLRIRAGDIELPADEDADGLRPGRVILIADVSERARAERMKTDFAANASHELRTPLSAIRAAVETLRSSCPANDDGAFVRCVEIIERHAARMEALVEDLLDLSKLETPGMRWSRSDVSLPRLLDDIRRQYAEAIEEKRLRWDVQIEPAAKTISANAELLRMVLRNLADNAIKFTEPGGRVTVRAENEPDAVRIVVEDDGCGIPPRERERVFERFYQVERSRSGNERGTGLGLSIVRHATLALGGRVSLESEPGEGTRVTVRLPRSRTD